MNVILSVQDPFYFRNMKKHLYLVLTALVVSFSGTAQRVTENPYSKGTWFIYWGWNQDAYSHSDIRFTGNDYDFTLYDVKAIDRQEPFSSRVYLNPSKMTIPQYNLRIGYFFNDHYQISLGDDHMKYVMSNSQTVKMDGYIHNSGTSYDGYYHDDAIDLKPEFLQFEHTDGLNYENVEVRRFDVLFGRKHFALSVNEGFGVGVLVPRTNTTLMNFKRYDEFHLAGYGFAGVVSLNMTFFKYFFIQSEVKGGFIHMPDIRTTEFKADRASQHFFFAQGNFVLGANFRLWKK